VNNLYDGLAEVLLALLKNGDTRESVLQYLAEVINRNATRAHIQVDFSCSWNLLNCSYSVYDLSKALS
jgi:ubiquitin conjugation factor E4 B